MDGKSSLTIILAYFDFEIEWIFRCLFSYYKKESLANDFEIFEIVPSSPVFNLLKLETVYELL